VRRARPLEFPDSAVEAVRTAPPARPRHRRPNTPARGDPRSHPEHLCWRSITGARSRSRSAPDGRAPSPSEPRTWCGGSEPCRWHWDAAGDAISTRRETCRRFTGGRERRRPHPAAARI